MIKVYPYQNRLPLIPTVLSLNELHINDLEGLLDSGAGITTISREHLIALGFDLSIPTLEHRETTDATGRVTNSSIYRINLNIDNIITKTNYPVACSNEEYSRVDLLIGTDIIHETILFLNGLSQHFTIAT